MRILSWLIGLPLAVVIVVFALSNRQDAQLNLWPFDDGLSLPAYLTVLAPLFLGLLTGLALAGVGTLKARAAARGHRRRAAAFEREAAALRAAADPSLAVQAPIPGDMTVPP